MSEFLALLGKLFVTFFKIGTFGFGGGYGMISMIQFDVVDSRKWMTNTEFADILAISQMTPGPISINCATYVGYTTSHSLATNPETSGFMDPTWAGIIGSCFATFALCLPTIIMMIGVILWLFKNKENKYVKHALSSLKPVVVGLIFSAGVLMMNGENFIDWVSVIICAVVFVATYFFSLNPIYLIILCGAFGYIYY